MKAIWGHLLAAAIVLMSATGCTQQDEAAMAPLDEGDVVHSGLGPAEASNLERFDAFLAVTGSGGDDAVRIVATTEEGDPVYTDISYAAGTYVVYFDNTEDGYGTQERKKAAECTELVKTDRPDEFQEYACGDYSFMVKDF
ncbi:MAG TPA: DUF4362 domain-containing protein [Paenibacillus sp.]|nr:DUF4362 domain-containing protein [Paenibacillus sp.]